MLERFDNVINFSLPFDVERVFKPNSAYLIKQNQKYAVLKAETLGATGFVSPGQKHANTQGGWKAQGWDSAQVKKSIQTASDIIAFVTQNEGYFVIPLKTEEVQRVAEALHTRDNNVDENDIKSMVWYQMQCFPEIVNFIKIDNSAEKERQRKAILELQKNPKAFVSLGHILVCDAFLGNHDRFGRIHQWRNDGVNDDSIPENAGNIMITWDHHRFKSNSIRFLGIDFLDTQASPAPYMGVDWQGIRNKIQSVINSSPFDLEGILINFDLLKKNNESLQGIAVGNAINKLGNQVVRLRISGANPFTIEHSSQAVKGFIEGLERLKLFYDKYNFQRDLWPRGLQSRFNAIGIR